MNEKDDTRIVGRIDCRWDGGVGSVSSPVFEGDTHEFNADNLKKHLLELATGSQDPEDTFTYHIYKDSDDVSQGMVECSLEVLFRAVHPEVRIVK